MTLAEQSKMEGRRESCREIALNMIKLGLDLPTIAQSTGLSLSELQSSTALKRPEVTHHEQTHIH